MTTHRIGDRVTVTHDAHTGTWTGIVTNAWPAGGELAYAVRPDTADPDHPGYTCRADQLTAHTYSPGALVLYADRAGQNHGGHVATVREATTIGAETGYIVDVYGGDGWYTTWYTTADKLIPLPDGTPMFRRGDEARVADDTPLHAGRTGIVATPGFLDGNFGYWLRIDGAQEWVPAVALEPVKAVNPR